ncbi:MAG: hypothetical protein K9H49_17470 [Bacteroidales bacterium]|nr:hypothetical protein [Bacteroidales bacterium]MCF8390208.1 hypothetical protein [Bacteroidales bacterium]
MRKFFSLFILTVLVLPAYSQSEQIFSNIKLKLDTLEFSLAKNSINRNSTNFIAFSYNNPNPVCEAELFLKDFADSLNLELLSSGDYEIIDSVHRISNSYYKFKIQFKNLNSAEFLKFSFRFSRNNIRERIIEQALFPYTQTFVRFYPSNNELYIGEEKIFELITNNIENIHELIDWEKSEGLNYRVSSKQNQLRIHIIPEKFGNQKLEFSLKTKKPFIDSKGKVSYKLDPVSAYFEVKQSRLQFLSSLQNDITMDEEINKAGTEIQLDYANGLVVGKTYRIENQEDKGGALVAELYTKTLLTNNKVLCILRTYNFHRESEGYLYIKDGDIAKFITNFNITPKTKISSISVLKDGIDWSKDLSVQPGEVVDIRIEGQALQKASFRWEDVENITPDTAFSNENFALFKLKIPLNISKRKIQLFNHGELTGYSLSVREFSQPRNFDYLKINYGSGDKTVSDISGLLMHNKTIRDIVIDFDRNLIDETDNLYGKQYLKIDLKITGRKNELIELNSVDNIVVVPGERSPRSPYYDRKDETSTAISLNKILRKKTYDLEDWAKIEITIENKSEKYSGKGFKQVVELYVQKNYTFDIDVSFPAGLLINTFNDDASTRQYQSFGGISMAMIAQFSFYDAERPGKFKPYRIGAGFLALNAFNLTSSTDEETGRDMSIVVIGSIYPTRKDVKLTFPLYLGGGYMLNKGKWFVLLGPGIRVSL